MRYLDHPVFLSGYAKSGTTLLLAVFDNHPELVVIPEEPKFFNKILFSKDKATSVRRHSGLKSFLPQASQESWSKGSPRYPGGYPEFDAGRFDELVEQAARLHTSERDFLRRLVQAFVTAGGISTAKRKKWVSKQPFDEMYFPVMLKMFGQQGTFLYIIRDPRDVYVSIRRRRENRGLPAPSLLRQLAGPAYFAAMWQFRTKMALRYQKIYDNFHVLRYEDLALHPDTTLRRLCRLLEIENTPTLRVPTRHGKPWGGNSTILDTLTGISSDTVGHHTQFMDLPTRTGLERLLRPEMTTLKHLNADDAPAGCLPTWYAMSLFWSYRMFRVYFTAWYRARQFYVVTRYWLHARRLE